MVRQDLHTTNPHRKVKHFLLLFVLQKPSSIFPHIFFSSKDVRDGTLLGLARMVEIVVTPVDGLYNNLQIILLYSNNVEKNDALPWIRVFAERSN